MTFSKTTVKGVPRGQVSLLRLKILWKVGPRDPCEKTAWNRVSEEQKGGKVFLENNVKRAAE